MGFPNWMGFPIFSCSATHSATPSSMQFSLNLSLALSQGFLFNDESSSASSLLLLPWTCCISYTGSAIIIPPLTAKPCCHLNVVISDSASAWRVQSEVWSVEFQVWHLEPRATFIQSTHARTHTHTQASVAHGAHKFYRWKRSRCINLISAPPRATHRLELCYNYLNLLWCKI